MIYDCFLYNGEKELLEIRLNELCLCEDSITHVIVESNLTHTGNIKRLYFEQHKKEFERFNIMYLLVDDFALVGCNTAKEKEAYQRNAIKKAMKFNEPNSNDTVIISDVDEVPRAKSVNLFLKSNIDFAAFILDKYAYYLNCIESEQSWDRCRIMKWVYLYDKTPEEVRNSGYDFSIHHAGFHWSWVIDPIRKLGSFSHTELDTHVNVSKIIKRENFWNTDSLKFIDINLSHPRYLFENVDKFQHLIK